MGCGASIPAEPMASRPSAMTRRELAKVRRAQRTVPDETGSYSIHPNPASVASSQVVASRRSFHGAEPEPDRLRFPRLRAFLDDNKPTSEKRFVASSSAATMPTATSATRPFTSTTSGMTRREARACWR